MSRSASVCFALFLGLFAGAASAETTAFVNGRWWTGSGFVEGARYVRAGVFVTRPRSKPDRTEDLAGAYVVPPFGDAHNHMPGRAEEVSRIAEQAGVFYLMNPTILASAAPAVRKGLDGPGKIDAVLSMGAITAPGGHPEALYVDVLRPRVYPQMKPEDFLGDAFHHVSGPADIDPVLDRLVSQHAQFVKVMLLFSEEYAKRKDDPAYRGHRGVDPALLRAIVQAAHKRGLRVAVHIETAADFRVIVAAGADEAAHMPGYLGDPKYLEAYRLTDADAQAAARSHIVVVATAWLAGTTDWAKDQAVLSKAQAVQRDNLRRLKAAGVPLLIGTDGWPNEALKEARYLEDLGVLTPREALVSLAETTPAWILPGRGIGKLSPGYEASFLTLRRDPLRDPAAIESIIARVKQGVAIPEVAASPTPR